MELFYFILYVHMYYVMVQLLSCNFHSYFIIVFMLTCVLVLVVFLFGISYVTNLALWLQDFNKLTYMDFVILSSLLTMLMWSDHAGLSGSAASRSSRCTAEGSSAQIDQQLHESTGQLLWICVVHCVCRELSPTWNTTEFKRYQGGVTKNGKG